MTVLTRAVRCAAVLRLACRGATVMVLAAVVQFALIDPSVASADPFVEQAELLGHGAGFGGSGGVGDHAVALSADGNTALVGASGGQGAEPSYALLFTRSGATWSQPVSLVLENEIGVYRMPGEGFGVSVALSANGDTALVGDQYGKAFVFTKEGAGWRWTRIEPPPETVCPERFGEAVALSEDGNTAVVGDPRGCPENFDGSVWIYARSGSSWIQQAGPLHGEQQINPLGNDDDFGSTLALSGNGNTAIVGAAGEGGALGADAGAAWVYKRSGSTWSQDGPKLDPPGDPPRAHFGRSVAMAGNGSRAVISTAPENESSGAWIFDRGPGGWTAQALLNSGEGGAAFGWTVALSRSGTTALVGGPESRPEAVGEAWAFRFAPNGWIREPVQPPISTKYGNFGYSVALSGDGATALVSEPGLPSDSQREGAAFVFSGPPDSLGLPAETVTPTGGAGEGPRGGSPNSTQRTPIVGSLRQTHEAWREGRALARLARQNGEIPVGTTFGFSLNEASRVRFKFSQIGTGRILHGRCTDRPAHGRRLRRCRLAVSRGTLVLSASAGRRLLHFDGHITKRHLLPPGRYILMLTAEAAGRRSAPRSLRFRILPSSLRG